MAEYVRMQLGAMYYGLDSESPLTPDWTLFLWMFTEEEVRIPAAFVCIAITDAPSLQTIEAQDHLNEIKFVAFAKVDSALWVIFF